MVDGHDKFVTKDLYFAGLLYALGLQFLGITREGNICWFEFSDYERCINLYPKYLSKELKVSAKSYEEALKSLKSFLFNDIGLGKKYP